MSRRITVFMLAFIMLAVQLSVVPAGKAAAAGAITDVAITVENSLHQVNIQGTISAGSGKEVTITVSNPKGDIDFIEQTTSDATGRFAFLYYPSGSWEGKYTVTIGGETIAVPYKDEFRITAGPEDPGAPVWPPDSKLNAVAGNRSVTLTWNDAASSEGISGYRVTWADKSVMVYNSNTVHISGLTPEMLYTFKVEAVSPSGKWSMNGPSVSVTIPPDGSNGGGGDGNGGNGGNGGDSGNNSNSSNTGTGNPTVVLPRTEVKLENNLAVVSLGAAETVANIRLGDIGDHPLQVKAESVKVTLSRDTVAQWLEAAKQDKDAWVRVAASPVSGMVIGVNSVVNSPTSVQTIGMITDVSATLIGKDGKELPVAGVQSLMELAFPYEEGKADVELLGIYRFNNAAERWEYIGGVADPSRHEVVVQGNAGYRYALLQFNKSYADVPDAHWANRTLKVLSAKQIVTGMNDTSFDPQGTTTRAEFTALLVRALGIQPASKPAGFRDVTEGAWYTPSISAALEAGLIQGISDQEFAPNRYITREQIAVLLMRAYNRSGGTGHPEPADRIAPFQDKDELSAWAKAEVNQAVGLGLMRGRSDSVFAVKEPAVRTETAQAVLNLLQTLKKL
ncbi:S-layer homology domain-containing protein [Paenibacillus albidus]|uniref:S-layer homology domain-containing protein n=1 Tax=Paenibacillus albidus TaxID=2041023 RepID=UPI001BE524FE|nr:S-layer homology domain-containing protein [Paenibacillus albidus]MBT2291879.1 S-layer homology domain-containing protein [Paenibacillus albidus]